MKGDQRLDHIIIFRNGALFVPKEKTVLQKVFIITPSRQRRMFTEDKPAEVAADK